MANNGFPYLLNEGLSSSAAPTFTGSGTQGDPYQIWTPVDLDNIRYETGFKYYILMADLDLSSYQPWKTLEVSESYQIELSFDGNHHTISNIYLTTESAWNEPVDGYGYTGLFGEVDTYESEQFYFKDLTLDGIYIDFSNMAASVWHHVSPFVSYVSPAYEFSNIHIKNWTASFGGVDYGFQSIGGIFAISGDECIMTSCSVENVLIQAYGTHSQFIEGGILTRTTALSTSYCYVKDCTILLDVTKSVGATQYAGIFPIWANVYYPVNDCYALNVFVSGNVEVAGVCDSMWLDPELFSNVYVGNLNLITDVPNGIYPVSIDYHGNDYLFVTSSYVETSSLSYVANFTASGFTGSTTQQLKEQSTYIGWDFTNVWQINPYIQNGYPYLSWEQLTGSIPPTPPSFMIFTPNGGEMYAYGQLIPISWSFNPGS